MVDRRQAMSDVFTAEINDMTIGCGLILIALVALMWALCSFDPFDD